jgi:hypothetical protein
MKNLFNDISSQEKQRILEMHKSATKRNYLFEQSDVEMDEDDGLPYDLRIDQKGKVYLVTLETKEDHREGVVFVGKYRGSESGKGSITPLKLLFNCSNKTLSIFKNDKAKTLLGISEEARNKLFELAECKKYASTGSNSGEYMA